MMGNKRQSTILAFVFLTAGVLSMVSTSVYAHTGGTGQGDLFAEIRSTENSTDEFQQSISGTVTDANTGDPIPGTNIFIEQLQTGAASDIDGNYQI